MKIDLTYELTRGKIENYLKQFDDNNKALMSSGHLGTHFDVMGKSFSLDYTESRGVIFDVSSAGIGEVTLDQIELEKIQAGDFVLLRTGVSEKYDYGMPDYNEKFPQISWEVIEKLVEKKIRMIGVDMRGLRHGEEHSKADNFCSQRNVFVVENLVNLDKLLNVQGNLTIHVYPVNVKGFSGLPTRVIAEY